jgi:hypothetical protein
MTNSHRNAILLCLAILPAASCKDKPAAVGLEMGAAYSPDFFGQSVRVSLFNPGGSAYCFARSDLNPRLSKVSVEQNGRAVRSNSASNRGIVNFRGVDVGEGVEVVPTGRRDFFIDISDFPIARGPFAVTAKVDLADCAAMFSGKEVAWRSLSAIARGRSETAKAPAAPESEDHRNPLVN